MIFDVASLAALFFAHYVDGEMGKYELVIYTFTLLPSLGCLMLVVSRIVSPSDCGLPQSVEAFLFLHRARSSPL